MWRENNCEDSLKRRGVWGGNTWWWVTGHERMKVGGGVTYNHTTLTD